MSRKEADQGKPKADKVQCTLHDEDHYCRTGCSHSKPHEPEDNCTTYETCGGRRVRCEKVRP